MTSKQILYPTNLAEEVLFHARHWRGPNQPSGDTFALEALRHAWRTMYVAARRVDRAKNRENAMKLAESRARYYGATLAEAGADFPTAYRVHWQGRRGELPARRADR